MGTRKASCQYQARRTAVEVPTFTRLIPVDAPRNAVVGRISWRSIDVTLYCGGRCGAVRGLQLTLALRLTGTVKAATVGEDPPLRLAVSKMLVHLFAARVLHMQNALCASGNVGSDVDAGFAWDALRDDVSDPLRGSVQVPLLRRIEGAGVAAADGHRKRSSGRLLARDTLLRRCPGRDGAV